MINDLAYEPSYLIAFLSSSRSNEVDSLKGFSILKTFLYPNVNETQLKVYMNFAVKE